MRKVGIVKISKSMIKKPLFLGGTDDPNGFLRKFPDSLKPTVLCDVLVL